MELKRLPPWIRSRYPLGEQASQVRKALRGLKLHTVCEEARCPNLGECFSAGTATFLILGNTCTRNCRFCAVDHGIPSPPDSFEPERVAQATKLMNLKYAVITSVTRDDLSDGGAELYLKTIESIRLLNPPCKVEVLVPDFRGKESSLSQLMAAEPDVFAHNVETVPRLYPEVRPGASYQRSLKVLEKACELSSKALIKTGFMVGLGESLEEIEGLLSDLKEHGCQIVTIGQYLRPRLDLLPVSKYYSPAEFEAFRKVALSFGFLEVESGPLVRSSYHAERQFRNAQ
jgi:lipoic acid synthetase